MPYDPRRIRGYQSPYCTCYGCNEARRQKKDKRRPAEAARARAKAAAIEAARVIRRRAVADKQSERKARENEARRQQEKNDEKRRQSGEDTRRRAVADRQSEWKARESARTPTLPTPPRNMGITKRSAAALQDVMVSPLYWRRRWGGGVRRLFRLLRSVIDTALFYTLLIHVAAFVGILVYVGVQEGAPGGVLTMVADTFTSSREAYVQAWLGVAD